MNISRFPSDKMNSFLTFLLIGAMALGMATAQDNTRRGSYGGRPWGGGFPNTGYATCPPQGGYVSTGFCSNGVCAANSVCWQGRVCCALASSPGTIPQTCPAGQAFGECVAGRCGVFGGTQLQCIGGFCCLVNGK